MDAIQTFADFRVNVQHINELAEQRIHSIQEFVRTIIIHAKRRRPAAIAANLWPYTSKIATDIINVTPNMKDPDK